MGIELSNINDDALSPITTKLLRLRIGLLLLRGLWKTIETLTRTSELRVQQMTMGKRGGDMKTRVIVETMAHGVVRKRGTKRPNNH